MEGKEPVSLRRSGRRGRPGRELLGRGKSEVRHENLGKIWARMTVGAKKIAFWL